MLTWSMVAVPLAFLFLSAARADCTRGCKPLRRGNHDRRICHGINDRTLRKAVDDGASTMSDLISATGVSTCCGCCADCAPVRLLVERLPLAA